MPDQNKKMKLKCPRCGESEFSKEHQGGSTMTFLMCLSCGYKAAKEAWLKQQEDLSVIAESNQSKIIKKATISGLYSEYGYSIFSDDTEIYSAGNHPFESDASATVDLEDSTNDFVPESLDSIKKMCEISALEFAKERNELFDGISYDENISDEFDLTFKQDRQTRYFTPEEERENRKLKKIKELNIRKHRFPTLKPVAQSVANNNMKASDAPAPENDPTIIGPRNKDKKYRTKPEKRLMPGDEEDVRNIGRVAMGNPFVKQSLFGFGQGTKSKITVDRIGIDYSSLINLMKSYVKYKVDEIGTDPNVQQKLQQMGPSYSLEPDAVIDDFDYDGVIEQALAQNPQGRFDLVQFIRPLIDSEVQQMISQNTFGERFQSVKNPFAKQSRKNPFAKEARDFRRSPDAQKLKDDAKKNMVFPEGQSDKDSEDGEVGKGSNSYDTNSKFNIVDRKEYRSSPDPDTYVPGHKEWKEKQVDQFYDGWVEDHIVNSGGKLVGSNTEKTMNLNDGERSHPPEFPTEAAYEKLLESRHNFDGDYTRVIADNQSVYLTKNAAETITKLIQNKQDCPDCKKKLLTAKNLKSAKSKFSLHTIPM